MERWRREVLKLFGRRKPKETMIHELIFTHLAPLSVAECINHFTEPHLLKKWFCDRSWPSEHGLLLLGWGQDHFVTWKIEPITEPNTLTIVQQFMGRDTLETVITVWFESQAEGTQITATMLGEI